MPIGQLSCGILEIPVDLRHFVRRNRQTREWPVMVGNQSPQVDRRRFGILAAWSLFAAGVSGGRAIAATEEELLRDFVPHSQDRGYLMRRISGLRMRHWQDHFSDVSRGAILSDTNDRVL